MYYIKIESMKKICLISKKASTFSLYLVEAIYQEISIVLSFTLYVLAPITMIIIIKIIIIRLTTIPRV